MFRSIVCAVDACPADFQSRPHIVGTQSIRKTSLCEEATTVSLCTAFDPVQSACDEPLLVMSRVNHRLVRPCPNMSWAAAERRPVQFVTNPRVGMHDYAPTTLHITHRRTVQLKEEERADKIGSCLKLRCTDEGVSPAPPLLALFLGWVGRSGGCKYMQSEDQTFCRDELEAKMRDPAENHLL